MRSQNLLSCLLAGVLFTLGTATTTGADLTVSGTVLASGENRIIVATDQGFRLFALEPQTEKPRDLTTDDVVIVRYREAGDGLVARQILRVDEQVTVREGAPLLQRAVLGRVQVSSPDHLIVDTPSGEQAFVLRPEVIRPRPLRRDSAVAVLYRVEERAGRDRYVATDLVEVPELPATSPVVVRSAPMPAEAAEVEPLVRPEPQVARSDPDREVGLPATLGQPLPGEFTREEIAAFHEERASGQLPQTASASPLLTLMGLLALAASLGLRLSHRPRRG